MLKNFKKENENIKKQCKDKIRNIHYRWCIFCLVECIIAILTYKLWAQPAPVENLISVGSGLVSIALGIFAISYSMTESIKANSKERKTSLMLNKIEGNVTTINNTALQIKKAADTSLRELFNIKVMNSNMKEKLEKFDFEKFNEQANKCQENISGIVTGNLDRQVFEQSVENTMPQKFRRGDLCLANLENKSESLLGGIRYVVVVQNSLTDIYTPSLTVIPIVKVSNAGSNLPTHVLFDWKNEVNIAVVEQITTISKSDILYFIDQIDQNIMKMIERAILVQFEI